MATYASAAADPSGFYDVAALAPALDGFFVMAYDMNSQTTPSATAPLVGGGYNDTEALQQFTAVVPPSKIILGVPYYGYDWPTTTGTSGAAATGAESPLSDSVIAASGHPTYWDPTTQTAWTSYQVGTQWHETYFDDPDLAGAQGPAGRLLPHRRPGHLGLGHGRQQPGHVGRVVGQRPGGQGPADRADQHRPERPARDRVHLDRGVERGHGAADADRLPQLARHHPVCGDADRPADDCAHAHLPGGRAADQRVGSQQPARCVRGRGDPTAGLCVGHLDVHAHRGGADGEYDHHHDDRPVHHHDDRPDHVTTTTTPPSSTTRPRPAPRRAPPPRRWRGAGTSVGPSSGDSG